LSLIRVALTRRRLYSLHPILPKPRFLRQKQRVQNAQLFVPRRPYRSALGRPQRNGVQIPCSMHHLYQIPLPPAPALPFSDFHPQFWFPPLDPGSLQNARFTFPQLPLDSQTSNKFNSAQQTYSFYAFFPSRSFCRMFYGYSPQSDFAFLSDFMRFRRAFTLNVHAREIFSTKGPTFLRPQTRFRLSLPGNHPLPKTVPLSPPSHGTPSVPITAVSLIRRFNSRFESFSLRSSIPRP